MQWPGLANALRVAVIGTGYLGGRLEACNAALPNGEYCLLTSQSP